MTNHDCTDNTYPYHHPAYRLCSLGLGSTWRSRAARMHDDLEEATKTHWSWPKVAWTPVFRMPSCELCSIVAALVIWLASFTRSANFHLSNSCIHSLRPWVVFSWLFRYKFEFQDAPITQLLSGRAILLVLFWFCAWRLWFHDWRSRTATAFWSRHGARLSDGMSRLPVSAVKSVGRVPQERANLNRSALYRLVTASRNLSRCDGVDLENTNVPSIQNFPCVTVEDCSRYFVR